MTSAGCPRRPTGNKTTYKCTIGQEFDAVLDADVGHSIQRAHIDERELFWDFSDFPSSPTLQIERSRDRFRFKVWSPSESKTPIVPRCDGGSRERRSSDGQEVQGKNKEKKSVPAEISIQHAKRREEEKHKVITVRKKDMA